MRMTARVRDIISMNIMNYYIPLIIRGETMHIYPMYYARMIGENTIAIPVTGSTGIGDVLKSSQAANLMAVDRAGGFEAYMIEGNARYVTDDMDYQLVAAMRNEVPAFPIHATILFEIESVHLVPPL
ncbi:MAG: hypothetical protein ACYC27_01615 [Armatimonadota bacterium]